MENTGGCFARLVNLTDDEDNIGKKAGKDGVVALDKTELVKGDHNEAQDECCDDEPQEFQDSLPKRRERRELQQQGGSGRTQLQESADCTEIEVFTRLCTPRVRGAQFKFLVCIIVLM